MEVKLLLGKDIWMEVLLLLSSTHGLKIQRIELENEGQNHNKAF